MNYGVVLNYNTLNIGDDIQTYAALKLLPNVDHFLDREKLNIPFTNETIKFICNGWFMDNPLNWPPAPNLLPLFVSFHITNTNESFKKLISKDLFNYYQKYEPIGCRDLHTLRLFKSLGIKSYFSGCLSLTIENMNTDFFRNEDILIIDPFMFYVNLKYQSCIIDNLIPASLQKNIKFLSHFKKPENNVDSRLRYISEIVEIYSKAHLIITSRIHVALPAMALGTPVLFVDLGYDKPELRTRLGGLFDLFTTIDKKNIPFTGNDYFSRIYRKIGFYKYYFPKKIDYNWENPPKPPETINEFKIKLKKTVFDFLKSN